MLCPKKTNQHKVKEHDWKIETKSNSASQNLVLNVK